MDCLQRDQLRRAQTARRGTIQKRISADLAAANEFVVREFLTRKAVPLLVAMILFVLRSGSLCAQASTDQSVKVQQLQMKLAAMEKEMQELKQEIGALQQQAQKPPAPAKTEETTENALDRAVSEQASAHVPLEQVANAPLPQEPGTTIDYYGFAMLDPGYDFATNNPNWFDVVRPTQLNALPEQTYLRRRASGSQVVVTRSLQNAIGDATAASVAHYQTAFQPLLYGVGLAIILTLLLTETGPAVRTVTASVNLENHR